MWEAALRVNARFRRTLLARGLSFATRSRRRRTIWFWCLADGRRPLLDGGSPPRRVASSAHCMRACIGYLRVPAAGDGETLFALLNFSSDAPPIVLRDLGQPLGPVRPLLSTAG